VNPEIAAEYGRLPPAFLPLGHERLFVSQQRLLSHFPGETVITLPEDFTFDRADDIDLDRLEVQVLRVPVDLTLAESILYALVMLRADGPLRLLHGDTYFASPLPSGLDVVSSAESLSAYAWGYIHDDVMAAKPFLEGQQGASDKPPRRLLTGYFTFSDSGELARCLATSRGRFIEALNAYHHARPVQAKPVDGWADFGHLQTFYGSRTLAATARSFNKVRFTTHAVTKGGMNQDKLRAEATWYERIPPQLRLYTPAYLGQAEASCGVTYSMENEYSPTLHELYVFGRLPRQSWTAIIASCFEFLGACRQYLPNVNVSDAIERLALIKTLKRLDAMAASGCIDLSREWKYGRETLPSLPHIAEETAHIVATSESFLGVMHGDFCFTNIFFDFRRGLIKTIDPRGSIDDETPTIFGDIRYDLAKLSHSIEGYDLILAGRFAIDESAHGPRIIFASDPAWLRSIAAEQAVDQMDLGSEPILALTIHLFLSMLPLHADRPDRQRAFLLNALRLYSRLIGKNQDFA
jgi:hypothetical protein